MTDTETRVAIVTGGASGIGLAIAERLSADGNAVAVFDLDGSAAEAAADKIVAAGGNAIGLTVDVTDRRQIDAGVDETRSRLGRPTILVNSAGLDGFDPFLKISAEKWNRILAVNLTGTFDCCQAVLPDMIEAGWGRIVNISSSSTHSGQPMMAHYVAAKSGVIGLTKSLALEFGPKGITVNTIPPGFIDTPMLRRSEAKGLLGEGVEYHAAHTPVRRAGRPEDIAATCSFLVRDEASYITGQVIGVNGGRNTDTPRLVPLLPSEWPDTMRAAIAALRPPEPRHPFPSRDADRPKGLNALGLLARHPALTTAFNTFNGHVLFATTLSPRQRELLVLRVAALRDSTYEWAQHAVLAEDAGLDRDEVARIAEGPEAGWSGLEHAMLQAVDELVADAKIADGTWTVLAAELDEHQLMDLVFTVGAYDALAMAFRSFGVPLDDDLLSRK